LTPNPSTCFLYICVCALRDFEHMRVFKSMKGENGFFLASNCFWVSSVIVIKNTRVFLMLKGQFWNNILMLINYEKNAKFICNKNNYLPIIAMNYWRSTPKIVISYWKCLLNFLPKITFFIISKGRWTSIEVINISLEFFFQGLQNGQLKLQIGVYFKKLWIMKVSYWIFEAGIALVKRTMHTFVILQWWMTLTLELIFKT
jgi:hypothetical protein